MVMASDPIQRQLPKINGRLTPSKYENEGVIRARKN
jgi:hypothetical protein